MTKEKAIGLLRIALGFIFLWAFLDKTFGLGFATTSQKSWMMGNSPTTGFLEHGVEGPFAGIFASMSQNMFVDLLYMTGMLGIGLALILGIGMKVATISGVLMMTLIYLSLFPPENNPFVDEHIIYILTIIALYKLNAGDYYGLGTKWKSLDFVKKNSWLM